MRTRVLPYKAGSKTAKELAKALGGKRLRHPNKSRFVPRPSDFIINWGFRGNLTAPNVVNSTLAVADASNKLRCLSVLRDEEINCPTFTTSKEEALEWGVPFIARSDLNGSGGKDALYVDPSEGEPALAGYILFSQYIKKVAEYRVHVFDGEVLDLQQKRKRHDAEADFKIRNHDRGWVFCRHNVDEPDPSVYEYSVAAVEALGLTFGAVDVIWNQQQGDAYIIEVNTAPGLQATTFDRYVDKFKELRDEQ